MSHDNLGFTSSTVALQDFKKSSSSKEYQNGYGSNEKHVYSLELEEKTKNVDEQDDDYDPYDYRVVEHPTTNAETLLHLLKGSLGTGILAMPKAFHNAGYIVGLTATIIIGLLCTYCMRILVFSEYELCKRRRVPSMTYPATAESALLEGPVCLRRFSKASIHIINTFLMIYQMGTCCVYIVFISSNLKTIMPLENEMKTPRSFMKPFGVLNIAMSIIIAMYATLGFFGYIRFGKEIKGSITLNLPHQEPLGIAVQILLAIAIFFTHPIQCYVAIDISWNEYISPSIKRFFNERYKLFWEYVVRTVIILITFGLAVTVPELDLFISLFGAFCLSGLGLAFPAIIQLCAFWKVMGPTEKKIMLAKNMCLILIGMLGLFVGTYTSLCGIIAKFS
ncbi:proton-coupled amino acid transporter-like protein CG1139 isoform X2 [Polyergus mexicanus]|uniref:proton-coupled amino acid transporter-like protein CG1139 isoform X2 n=1 Tax=Polyergus mexicanus TaxID=615972 RepID=UPI0038B53281